MRRILISVVILLMVVSVVGLAQASRYTFVKNFPNDAFRTAGGNGGHGIAVDPEGKVWFQPYDVAAESVLVASTGKYARTRVIYVWKPDGTPASFSPIKTVTVGTVTDTLWNSSRGIRADANGNIVFCSFDTYYRVNYKTGAGMTKIVANFNNTGIQPAFDSFNEMFSGLVIPKGPIKIHDNSGAFLGNVADSAEGFARSIEVSPDGNDVFWAGYTNNAVYRYHSDNGSLGPYKLVDTIMVGLSVESITRNPKTGVYWASGGSAGSVDRGYRNYKWYAFTAPYKTPVDSFAWSGSVAADPRPRGLAFTPTGDTAYVCSFGTNTVGSIQMFVKKAATQVTFWANTATVPDTIKAKSFVQIRGSASLFGPWGLSSSAILTNVGGDYWKGTFSLNPGDTIQYKFFTNANTTVTSAIGDQGWENNTTDASGNRILIVPKSDTVLPLQFVNGTPSNQPQYFTPYVNQKDSIEVWFRINMAGNEGFNKATQFMGVRGGFTGTPYKDWGRTVLLSQESPHGNGGSRQYDASNLWSGYVRVPKSTFASDLEYKFVILGSKDEAAPVATWEDGIKAATDVTSGGNRVIKASPGISDTTLYWKWWANNPAVGFKGSDTVIVTFRANMSRAVAERGFTFSDTLQVRSGYGGTAAAIRTKLMTRSGITGSIFTATDTVIAAVGKPLNYQYYLVKSGNDVREVFYNFDYVGSDNSQAERRNVTAAKGMTVNDTTSSGTDIRRMPRFRNTSKLTKNVTVTYTVDVRPAYYTVKAGKKLVATNITPWTIANADSVLKWGVWMNGPAVGGWDTRGAWGPNRRADTTSKMFDDGTHGDLVKGDSIYSLLYQYTTSDFVGQEFKFGIGGFDNEGGFGNNHIENVDDAASTFTLASQFGSIDPKFYSSWDFDLKKPKLATAVEGDWMVPMVYDLSQNYPNPFNPATTIRFTLPTEEVVTLKVFNMLGQEVMTLLNQRMGVGTHVVRFDASRLTSGVYFYQINAGKFVETKKMMLLK